MAEFADITKSVEAQNEAVAVTIYKPTLDPYLAPDGKTPCTISMLGAESRIVREAQKRASRKRQQLYRRNPNPSPEELDAIDIEVLVAGCTEWFGWTAGGELWEFTPENLTQMLQVPHIRRQVEAGIDGHAGFSKPTSSASSK